jgi:hypothetical protein
VTRCTRSFPFRFPGRPPARRTGGRALGRGRSSSRREVTQAHALHLGLGTEIQAALGDVFERWDGNGFPAGRRGDRPPRDRATPPGAPRSRSCEAHARAAPPHRNPSPTTTRRSTRPHEVSQAKARHPSASTPARPDGHPPSPERTPPVRTLHPASPAHADATVDGGRAPSAVAREPRHRRPVRPRRAAQHEPSTPAISSSLLYTVG